MKAPRIAITAGVGLIFCSLGAQAQPASAAAPQAAASAPISAIADGEVRKVDKEAGKLTLRHGPLPHLDMGAMTMVFRVSDPTLLDQVKTGDKVRFTADRVNGQFTVTRIERAK
ncbi:MAG TPA: copper-binding protein [Rubrivivax sp.]|nr:copper-binding protein [Rubrivivax sp.]